MSACRGLSGRYGRDTDPRRRFARQLGSTVLVTRRSPRGAGSNGQARGSQGPRPPGPGPPAKPSGRSAPARLSRVVESPSSLTQRTESGEGERRDEAADMEARRIHQTPLRLVVIGASAGGLQAITTVLSGLPRDLPAAVLVVEHPDPPPRSLRADLPSRRP